MNKSLCLYTAQFPYGQGEQFLETEIKYLSKSFEKVFIFPFKVGGSKRIVPDNVFVVRITEFNGYTAQKAIKYFGKWFIPFFRETLKFNNLKKSLSLTLKKGYQSEKLFDYLKTNNLKDSIHYTYWFEKWTTILSVLKNKNKIKMLISRAHRYDLYTERSENKFIPYRKFQLKHIDNLFLISKQGLNYISKKYPKYKLKYKLSYLGTADYGMYSSKKKLIPVLVSCSFIVPIKRLYLIAEALKNISFSLKWIHIGDGPERSKIENICKTLPKNIEVEFKGHLTNYEVLSFYKKNYVTAFINVSESEGLPVSIMEAISFGIPIIATDVGGVSEIVNPKTGKLIPEDISVGKLSETIEEMLKENEKWNRGKIREFWYNNFNAEKNYTKFISEIRDILNIIN